MTNKSHREVEDDEEDDEEEDEPKREHHHKSGSKWIWVGIVSVVIILAFIFILNSNKNSQNEVACNSPYIKVGTSCCLDQDYNNICDNDETSTQNQQAQEEEQKKDFLFRIEEVSYDCLVNKLPRSSSQISIVTSYLNVERSSNDNGVVDNIIISYPKDSELPNGEWRINIKVLTSSGNTYFENSASFNQFSGISCNNLDRTCISPFAYDIIPSPYIKGGSAVVSVSSPDGKVETKEVPLPGGDCNVLSLNGEQLFSIVQASFINNDFTQNELNPSGFNEHSDGGLFIGGGAYSGYDVNMNEGFSSIYYFDNIYKTSTEELAEKINELGYLSATIISTPDGKYIKQTQSPEGFVTFEIICGHKAVISIPLNDIGEDKILNVVNEILPQCN